MTTQITQTPETINFELCRMTGIMSEFETNLIFNGDEVILIFVAKQFYNFFKSAALISYEPKSRLILKNKSIYKKTSSVDCKLRVTTFPIICADGTMEHKPAAILKGFNLLSSDFDHLFYFTLLYITLLYFTLIFI